jgi:hypothetical protein
MPRKEIRDLVGTLKIPNLIHFTRAVNLPSIMEHGLYPRSRIAEVDAEPVVNDQLRLDGHLDGTSVSIAFPNNSMFYRYRKDPGNAGIDWVVLGLNPSILWEKDCAFCMHNAADGAISCQDLDTLRKVEALAGMFEEIEGVTSRAEQKLKAYDPTDVQAEVLVFDVIEPRYIYSAAFETKAVQNKHSASLGDRRIIAAGTDKGYFGSRGYSRKYK